MKFLLCIFSCFISLLPEPLLKFSANFLAHIWFYLIPYRKNLIVSNLNLAYSTELSRNEIYRLAKKNMIHYIEFGFENILLTHLSSAELKKRITFENEHYLREVMAQGKGCALLTAHVGNFEWAVAAASLLNVHLAIVARLIKNKNIQRFVSQTRKQWNCEEILPQRAAFQLFRLLKKNRAVGFMIDQRKSPPDGIYVNFFGKPAATTQGLAYLIERTDAMVLPIYSQRTHFGRFVIRFDAPIEYKRVGTREENIYYNTQIYTTKVEEIIRQCPEQWFWIHRRWKGSPLRANEN